MVLPPLESRNLFLKEAIGGPGFLNLGGLMVRPAVFHRVSVVKPREQGWHHHPFWELTWVREGTNRYHEKKAGGLAPRKPGDTFFMPAGDIHRWEPVACPLVLDGFMLEIFPLTQEASLVLERLRAATRLAGYGIPDGLGEDFMAAVDGEIAQPALFGRTRVNLLLQEFLLRLFRAILPPVSAGSTGKSPSSQTRLFQLAREWIDQHLGEDPSLPDLGKALEVTPRTLNRIFGSVLGMPCGKYIQERKLVHGYHLLQTRPTIRVREVARLSGFEDPAYFTRAFTSRFGIPPTEARESFLH